MVERNLRRVARPGLSAAARCAGLVTGAFARYARYWVESFRLPGTPAEDLDRRHRGRRLGARRRGPARPARAPSSPCPTSAAGSGPAFWLTACQGVPGHRRGRAARARPSCSSGSSGCASSLGMHVVPLGPDAGSGVLRRPPGQPRRSACCATATSAAAASRSSSSASARRCRAGRPPSPCAPARRCSRPRCTSRATGTAAIVRPPLDTERRGRLRDDVARVTQDLAHELEGLIRRAPEQWHLLQPNWPSDHEALRAAGF